MNFFTSVYPIKINVKIFKISNNFFLDIISFICLVDYKGHKKTMKKQYYVPKNRYLRNQKEKVADRKKIMLRLENFLYETILKESENLGYSLNKYLTEKIGQFYLPLKYKKGGVGEKV